MAKPLTLKFDLMSILNESDMPRSLKRAVAPSIKSPTVKREFGRRAIDIIVDRTLKGVDKDGDLFTKYSKSYRESDDFKIAGKTARPVNLRLTGQMLANIEVVDIGDTTVTIGFTSQTQNDKATGHVKGSGDLPIRDFWGLDFKDAEKTLKDTVRDLETEQAQERLEDALASIGGLELVTQLTEVGEGVAAVAAVTEITFDLPGGFDG